MNTFWTLAIFAVAITFAGCEKDKPGASGGPSSPQGTSGQANLKPLDILIDWQAEPTYMGFYYAEAIGAFKEIGLDVTIVQSWGANEAAAAIAAGKYKIGTASGGATAIANSSGANLLSTAVIYRRLPTAIFGLKEAGIEKPKDLEGKTVGIYAKSITKNEFEAFVKLNGLNRDKIKVEAISGPDLPLILARKVDAVLNYFELSPTQLALQHPTFQLLLDDYGVKGYGLNIVTSRDTYQRDPALVKSVTQAALRGYQEGCANQDSAVRAFLKDFPEKDPQYVATSWKKVCEFIGGTYGSQDASGWRETIGLYSSLGLLNGPVSPDDVMI